MGQETIFLIFGLMVFGLLIILSMGVPIAFAIGFIVMALVIVAAGPAGLVMISTTAYELCTGFTLLAVPAYILMAELLVESGATSLAFTGMSKWLGRLPGGMATATVAASAVTAATLGSSVANTATIGLVASKEMKKFDYDQGLACGAIMAGGALGILIPPSLTFIIFGIATEQSIAHLFMGGLLPGIVLAVLFMIAITLLALISPRLAPRAAIASRVEKWRSLRQIAPLMLLAAGLLYFIYFGVATPSEVGALGSLAAFLFCLQSGRLSWKRLKTAGLHTVSTTAMVVWLVIAATSLGHVAAYYGVSEALVKFVTGLSSQKYVVILGINILLLMLGCFLDPAAIILITTPFLMPIILHYGFDPLWFGVLFMVNMEMGYLTPPFGMNLFVMKKIAPHIPLEAILKGMIPFLICQAICIVLLVLFPQMALWIPGMMKR